MNSTPPTPPTPEPTPEGPERRVDLYKTLEDLDFIAQLFPGGDDAEPD